MKNTVLVSMLAVSMVLAFTSNAAASEPSDTSPRQLSNGEVYKNHRLDVGKLHLGTALMGAAGGIAGGFAGLAVASSICTGGWECLRSDFIGIAVGGAAGTLSGSMLSLALTAPVDTEAGDVGGAFLGGLVGSAIGIPVGFFGTIAGINAQSVPIIAASVIAGGAAITVGTVIGFEHSYTSPIKELSVAPLVSPTHQGFTLVGRF